VLVNGDEVQLGKFRLMFLTMSGTTVARLASVIAMLTDLFAVSD